MPEKSLLQSQMRNVTFWIFQEHRSWDHGAERRRTTRIFKYNLHHLNKEWNSCRGKNHSLLQFCIFFFFTAWWVRKLECNFYQDLLSVWYASSFLFLHWNVEVRYSEVSGKLWSHFLGCKLNIKTTRFLTQKRGNNILFFHYTWEFRKQI